MYAHISARQPLQETILFSVKNIQKILTANADLRSKSRRKTKRETCKNVGAGVGVKRERPVKAAQTGR